MGQQDVLVSDYVMATISNQEINCAIKRLQHDHNFLEKNLQGLIKLTQLIVNERGSIRNVETLQTLRKLAQTYQEQLSEHAKWEEETLFPMMALYFSGDINELTSMEQEHALAEHFIQAFVDAIERAPVRYHDEREMLSYLTQAADILRSHFNKEEEVLFTLLDYSHVYGY